MEIRSNSTGTFPYQREHKQDYKKPSITQRNWVLHIDIDGNDYWIWKEITDLSPVIVIMEYNSVFGDSNPWTIPYKKDFFRTFKSYLESNKPLSMIVDSLMTPTFIDDIAFGLKYLFNNYRSEIFHLVGSQSISPYDAAIKVAETFGLDKSLIGKTTYEEYVKGKARLPQFATIKSNKNNFWKMKTFSEGLEEIKKQL